MQSRFTTSIALALLGLLGLLAGCSSRVPLGAIYSEPAQRLADQRTPVIVIPGVLGSKLEDGLTGQKVWGSFTFGAADTDLPEGAREAALPMREGVPLRELRDQVEAVDVLDTLEVDLGPLRGIQLAAYVDILETLAVGKYRDASLGRAGAVDYGGRHYTCFQYPYDWRRDIAEQAGGLARLIREAQQAAREEQGLAADAPVKVDVVAHSMGGLVLRYYLRYGTAALPEDGSLPEITWAGAADVRLAILVGTPNLGATGALRQLVEGWDLNPFFPNYRASVLGTMPSIYQLLPRSGAAVVDAWGKPLALYDPATWEHYQWGLLDPRQAEYLSWLLPDETPQARRRIAADQIRKSLARAEQFHRAIDVPASPPAGTEIFLFAGDEHLTETVVRVRSDGELEQWGEEAGDGSVARYSALGDLRWGQPWQAWLRTPVAWQRVQFLDGDHQFLTNGTDFADNLLYLLMERPPPR